MNEKLLAEAISEIHKYPESFLHAYYVVGALQRIKLDYEARTEETDTLSVSLPIEVLEDLSKLEWLPFIEDTGVSVEGDKLIFDWFTLPEDKTGFGIAASEFVETLIKAMDAIDDPDPYSEETIAAMEEAKCISRDPNVPSYDTMDELKAALEADDDE